MVARKGDKEHSNKMQAKRHSLTTYSWIRWKDNLQEEFQPDEVEIIHRIGQKKKSDEDQGSRQESKRAVITTLQLNKSKMKILLKQRLLKGKEYVIMEDIVRYSS